MNVSPDASTVSTYNPAAMIDTPPADRPRCRCGHDRDHFMVSPVAHYTFLGWVLVITGISAPITHMDFRCRQCDQILETITDRQVMEEYRYRA